ncbi:MAG: hypothetical protein M3Z04_10515, partial [Chloroflexota bacterium]|nr:hypothetical protein [Chloroflexota bacterium]
VSAIASGSVGGAAAAIEGALSAALPVAISFLANLLGLGGISEKIKSIIGKVRAPVEKAVDWVIGKAVTGLKKVGGLFTGKGKNKGGDPSKDAAKGTAPGSTPADPKAAGTPQPNAAQPGADARTPEQKKADLDAGVAEADKLVQKEDLSDAQIRKLLPAIKAKYHMTALDLVIDRPTDAGSFAHVHGAVNPEEDSPKRKRRDSAGDLIKAKAAFGHRLFSWSELSATLGASKTTALARINEWLGSGALFQLASDTFDPETEYSFDATKAGQREISPNNRAKYGYHPNPDKTSSAGLEILSKGLRSDSPPPIEHTSSLYHQQKARYHSMRPGSSYTNFGWPDAILGHKMELGASEHWNRIGHTQSKAQNRVWNQNPANYHGPEHKTESSASGSTSERYRVPSKAAGSHPDWW